MDVHSRNTPEPDEHGAHGRIGRPNRLIHEKSPYLLQHAYNPVDWFPWGQEAFDTARELDKPIFLSIGYSTCHWCHVMEKESFEDTEVAELMNDAFISIKVDREERPDIDNIYMTVCQMMTGGGGWPLNLVMTPDKRPFFAGTYFPKATRHGRIGMMDLGKRIKELWAKDRGQIALSADKVVSALRQIPDDSPGDPVQTSTLAVAYQQLGQRFDESNGGFGAAPKFPTPHNMLFLFRYRHRTGEAKATEMALKTLRSMSLGGIHDHVGGGFHRYSTDENWLVPHFEKMLYDQALLAMAYTEAYLITRDDEFKRVASGIFEYVMRDMVAPQGAFFSAEDADSEGEEGKFYTWSWQEIQEVLDPEESRVVQSVFNIRPEGNFREEASGEMTGTNILHRRSSLDGCARDLNVRPEGLRAVVEGALKKLFDVRSGRIRPHRDDKVLADWNGLMIASLAKAGQVFGNQTYVQAATRAADFILETMRDEKGRLIHRFRDGHAGIASTIDDYAFFILGLLELYEAVFDIRYLRSALDLTSDMIARFWDASAGGFFITAHDSEELLVRKKDIYDGATPSGNSVALLCLRRLASMTANLELDRIGDRLEEAFSGNIRQLPSAYTFFLSAAEFRLGSSHEVVIVGSDDDPHALQMLKELRSTFLPHKVVLFKSSDEKTSELAEIAPFTESMSCIDGQASAYVCKGHECMLPTTDIGRMMELLNNRQQ